MKRNNPLHVKEIIMIETTLEAIEYSIQEAFANVDSIVNSEDAEGIAYEWMFEQEPELEFAF